MRVLLSGSHGLIGRALADRLAAEGHQVVRLVREGSGDAIASRPGTEVPWNPAEGRVDDLALAGAGPYQAVVHLAGAGIADRRWTPARRQVLRDSRVLSTRVLVGALRRLDPHPDVLVSASGIDFYGDQGDEVADEHSPRGEGFLADLCAAWEDEAETAGDISRVVRVRSGIVLARHGGALGRLLPLFRLGLGARMGAGDQYVSWISLRDEVGVFRRAIDDDRLAGPVNATAPEQVTNAAFAAAVARSVNRPVLLTIPAPLLRAALGRDMAQALLLGSKRVRPGVLEGLGHRFEDPTLGAALDGPLSPEG